ncbi:hypothetical protein JCM11641_006317 [Rhodosporidiobolus odoratus]
MTAPSPPPPASGGLSLHTSSSVLILVLVLIAYTVQTELASYVQHEVGYKKPYFLFYMTHSGYILLQPLHLVVLKLMGIPVKPALSSVFTVLQDKYSTTSLPYAAVSRRHREVSLSSAASWTSRTCLRELEEAVSEDWVRELGKKVAVLTVFISAPALSWYGAVPLTAMVDITAIYNSFAFWAYLLTLHYLPPASPSTNTSRSTSVLSRLNPLDALSVVLAISGVLVIAYGGGKAPKSPSEGEGGPDGASRLAGNLLALFGSISYAGYEVWYKLNVAEVVQIALPSPSSDKGAQLQTLSQPTSPTSAHFHLSSTDGEAEEGRLQDDAELEEQHESTSLLSSPSFTPLSVPESAMPSSPQSPQSELSTSPTTFFLYSTTLTSLIGLCTVLFLWIPIPLLHWIGWEAFEVPPKEVWGVIGGIIVGGVVFNGGFMIMLSMWGPVISSIANLLTLLLVAFSDYLFIPSAPPLTSFTLLGGAMIVLAFGGVIFGRGQEPSRARGRGRDRW